MDVHKYITAYHYIIVYTTLTLYLSILGKTKSSVTESRVCALKKKFHAFTLKIKVIFLSILASVTSALQFIFSVDFCL